MRSSGSEGIAWNQKNLDYEIETEITFSIGNQILLEIKRTSITRLKHLYWWNLWRKWCDVLKSKEPRLRDWNATTAGHLRTLTGHLKSKEPRLRDWNGNLSVDKKGSARALKSKEPRLRDWNACSILWSVSVASLEIKRTSITRLKQERSKRLCFWESVLKSKEPRLRDWN